MMQLHRLREVQAGDSHTADIKRSNMCSCAVTLFRASLSGRWKDWSGLDALRMHASRRMLVHERKGLWLDLDGLNAYTLSEMLVLVRHEA